MRRSTTTLTLFLFLLAACDGSIGGVVDPDHPMLGPCDPALAGTSASITVAPHGIAIIRVTGGTASHRYALVMGGSTGSRVEETTGVFVAGDAAGDEDVTVTDTGCLGEAMVSVHVSDALALEPATSDVAPDTQIQFVVRGGAGPFTFSMVRTASGATIASGGAYRAGAADGDDLVRVVDDVTGATADASIRVRTGAGLALDVGRVGVPVGSRHVIGVTGGSGYVDLTASSSSFTIDGPAIVAASPGDATITVTDHYTGTSVTVLASALGAATAPSTRVGDRSELNTVLAGDFDEDGIQDVLVAMPGSNLAASRAGAVLLLRGVSGGLEPEPARILTGTLRDDNFGSAATLGDLDHDGHLDLIVGSWQDDSLGSNVGAVFVYHGEPGAMFSAAPYLSLYGVSGGDRFGVAVAAGDFDGDGFTDLAVGAADDEDNARTPRRDQQGAVHIFPSYDGRILGRAEEILFGDLPDGAGGITSHNDMRFGSALAAGDFDGDGLTDLAVQAQKPDPATSSDGSVSLYRGVPAAGGHTHGGLAELPSMVWAATADGDRSGRFGTFLSMGDVDGDGLDDLLASQHVHDRPAMGATGAVNDLGAAQLFLGRALGMTPASAMTPIASADWTHEGAMSSALFGHGVEIADATGDGLADLVIAESRVTPMGSALSRAGQIHVFSGVRGGLPSDTPTRSIEGVHDDERFGNGLAIVGSAVFAVAPYADDGGLDTGRCYLVSSTSVFTEISIPGRASGRRLGQSVAFAGDLTGDGVADLVLGAPHQPDPSAALRGVDYGAAYVYAGDGSGFGTSPSATLAGYTLASNASHSESDWLGEAVSSAGDFDGDGRIDVAVVARFEDLPAAFDDTRWVLDGDCGTAARSDPGAVFVWSGVRSGETLSADPSFVYFGATTGRTIQMVAGDLDVNGDGLGDLIVGGANWLGGSTPERRGGYAVVLGRARDAGGHATVICQADAVFEGGALNDELGTSAARIGDLDGDGCDEVAIGAPRLDRPGATDEGGVTVLFGFGAGCASATPTSIVLRPTDRAMQAGTSVAGGVDLDGGGKPDLVVGAPRLTTTLGEVGRVFVLSGERILAQRAATGDVAFETVAIAGTWFVNGGGPGERLGTSVAVLADAGPGGADLVASGGLYANLGGTPNSGGARLFVVARTTGIGAPFAIIAGETSGAYPDLGASLATTGSGASARLAIGASWSSGDAVQEGSAYVFDP